MNIRYITNLDKYKISYFPILKHCPRVGEFVQVIESVRVYVESLHLPSRLIVKSITHTELGIMVELYYSEEQLKHYNINYLF